MNRLLALGFVLVIAGMATVASGSYAGGNLSTGGFVLIGPIPIVFGSGGDGGVLATLSVLLGLLMMALLLLMVLRPRTLIGKGDEEIDK